MATSAPARMIVEKSFQRIWCCCESSMFRTLNSAVKCGDQSDSLASINSHFRAWLHGKQNKLRCRAALNLLIMSLRILFKAWPRIRRCRRSKSRGDLTIIESDPDPHQKLTYYGRPGNPGALTPGELQNMSTHRSNTCSVRQPPMCKEPLAYGGPSCNVNLPFGWSISWPDGHQISKNLKIVHKAEAAWTPWTCLQFLIDLRRVPELLQLRPCDQCFDSTKIRHARPVSSKQNNEGDPPHHPSEGSHSRFFALDLCEKSVAGSNLNWSNWTLQHRHPCSLTQTLGTQHWVLVNALITSAFFANRQHSFERHKQSNRGELLGCWCWWATNRHIYGQR